MDKEVWLVEYAWDNGEDYDLHMDGVETIGIFTTYEKAYEAVQNIKKQEELDCNSPDLYKDGIEHEFCGYEESKYEARTSISWAIKSSDIADDRYVWINIYKKILDVYNIDSLSV